MSVGTAWMSEHDRIDRIERKLNRIGRSILFGIALVATVAAIVTEPYYDSLVSGHGFFVAAAFTVVVVVALLWARTPFRD
jgi:Na+/proline symporter